MHQDLPTDAPTTPAQSARNALARLLLEHAAEAIYLFEPTGKRLVEANPAFLRLTGYAAADVPRLTIYDFVAHPPADVDALVARGLAAGAGVGDVEQTWRRTDATTFLVRVTGGAARHAGRDLGFVLARDVSRRQRAEAALRREHDLVAAILDTAACLIVVLDRAGRIVRFNRACESATGYAFAEVRGRPFWELFLPPDELAPALRVFADLCTKRFPSTHQNHWLTKGGQRRLIAWSNTALLDGAGEAEYVVATGVDVTERVRAEVALHRFQIGLSPMERKVLPLLARADAASYRRIGDCLHIDGETVRTHVREIGRKLGVGGRRADVVAAARAQGLLDA